MLLKDLQKQFFAAMYNSEENAALITHIASEGRLSAAEKLAIYRRSIQANFIHALTTTYPVCHKLVGAAFFSAMAKHYVHAVPSVTVDLEEYGDNFANFITTFAPAQSLPYLADVARLEWACHQASRVANSVKMDMSKLAELSAVQQANLLFRLPVGAVLLASAFPIKQIWTINQNNYLGDEGVDLAAGAVHLIIWCDTHLHIDELSLAEWTLLQRISQQLTLAEIAEQTNIALLPELLSRGWISGFAIKAT